MKRLVCCLVLFLWWITKLMKKKSFNNKFDQVQISETLLKSLSRQSVMWFKANWMLGNRRGTEEISRNDSRGFKNKRCFPCMTLMRSSKPLFRQTPPSSEPPLCVLDELPRRSVLKEGKDGAPPRARQLIAGERPHLKSPRLYPRN